MKTTILKKKSTKLKANKSQIKIVLLSKNRDHLLSFDKYCRDLNNSSKTQKIIGPIAMKTKSCVVYVRLSPSGEGAESWTKYTTKTYKKIYYVSSASFLHEIVAEINKYDIDPSYQALSF